LRWVESEKLQSERGLSADDLPDATPVTPPEIPSKKESIKPPKKPVKSARKVQQPQTVVLPPQKPPIPDSRRGVEAGRHRGAIRAGAAGTKVVAQSLGPSAATRPFFALTRGQSAMS
jgi:hypothetical protein